MASRILVKGGSGAGKTTLGRKLAQQLGVPFVEMDALHHGPNWTAASSAELQARVRKELKDEQGWVVDGNYDSKLGPELIERAELIVWLDLPLPTKLWRLAHRTSRRWLSKEKLWNGNRESLKDAFWGRKALFPWAIRSHFSHRRSWPQKLKHRSVVRLQTSKDVAAWLSDFPGRCV